MMIVDYDYKQPQSLEEVFALLGTFGAKARMIAGGTDVLIEIKHGKINPEVLISLRGLKTLRYIRKKDGYRIGALSTHAMLEHSDLAKTELAALQQGAAQVGSVQLRNVATIGGNICNAAPSADTAAPLLALDASVVLEGPDGRREIPMADFFTGPSKTLKRNDEILVEIRIPEKMQFYGSAYWKHSRRRALNLPMVGVAAAVRFAADKTVKDAKIGLTVVAPIPIRATPAEEYLKGKPLSDEVLRKAGELASSPECCTPRDSLRCEGWYREEMIRVLIPRVVKMAGDQLKQSKKGEMG
jgi:carbon-monoxide dehydrogenase medium subunit